MKIQFCFTGDLQAFSLAMARKRIRDHALYNKTYRLFSDHLHPVGLVVELDTDTGEMRIVPQCEATDYDEEDDDE